MIGDEMVKQPETSQGRYRLGEVLGRGGMATVYRAHDGIAELDVAIKVLHPHLAGDEALEEAFLREARVMRAIDHPGVVRVHETTRVEGRPAIVMELCEGGELRERIARRGPLDEEEARSIMVHVLLALSAVHEQGVVHRDIKPHNILFDKDDRPRIIDFGIGQAQELLAAKADGQMGTVEYMAPERLDGLAIDGRSDLYSAGVMFFEMLTGHPPFRAGSAAAVMRMHREAPTPDPRVFRSDIGADTAQVVMGAMARHPEERFDGADQMIEALVNDGVHREELGAHPTWEAAQTRRGELLELTADIEGDGHEWVVFVPPDRRAEAARVGIDDAVVELVRRRQAYSTVSDFGLVLRQQIFAHRHSPGKFLAVEDGTMTSVYGIARGLSRDGAKSIIEELGEAGEVARIARRPRTRRREGLRRWSRNSIGLNAAIFVVIWGLIALIVFAVVGSVPVGAMPPALLYASTGVLGAMVGWIAISGDFREWWLSRISTSYLLDFALPPSTDADEFSTRALAALGEVRSPRVKASFERALNAGLHLQDRLQDSAQALQRIRGLKEEIITLGDEIRRAEERLAAIRPAELTRQLRRLDAQIADADDLDDTEALMDQRRELREQLIGRDDALHLLQARAQTLHDLSGRMEGLALNPAPDAIDDELAQISSASATASGS